MIYADYNGSAPLLPTVREHLKKRMKSDLFANPNAIHSLGQKVANGIEKCRSMIASVVGCFPDQLVFNSGSSEGLSQIVHSILSDGSSVKSIIVTSPIEHAVLLSAYDYYQTIKGFTVIELQVDHQGKVSAEELEKILLTHAGKVALVSVMAANNETGVIQPYQSIAKICNRLGIDYVCDTTQLIGKGSFNFSDSGVDYAVCSGHKVGALQGTGFIIAKDPTKLRSLVFGSTQEKGLRGGTQNYLGIETLAVALKDFETHQTKLEDLKKYRRDFEDTILKTFPSAVVVGLNAERLPGTTLIGYPGLHGQAVQIELESQDIFVTTSAACADNQPETSKVLKAMGIQDDLGRSVIRISLSYSHDKETYDRLASSLVAAYNKLAKIHSY